MKDDIFNYQGPRLTVDVVAFFYNLKTLDLKILLIERPVKPFKDLHALPGGFIHEHENSHETALRVLKEKTGISSLYIEQVKTFDTKNRDPRGQVFSIAYLALINEEELPKGFNAELSQLVSLKKVLSKKMELAFDHKDIVSCTYDRLQAKISYSNLSSLSLPKTFTLTDLQTLFEIVLGEEVDKRNFRKKITSLGFIDETDQVRKGQSKRPARLYRNKYKKSITYDRLI